MSIIFVHLDTFFGQTCMQHAYLLKKMNAFLVTSMTFIQKDTLPPGLEPGTYRLTADRSAN